MTHLWIQNLTYYNPGFTTLKHVHFIMGESLLLVLMIFRQAGKLNLQAKSLFTSLWKANVVTHKDGSEVVIFWISSWCYTFERHRQGRNTVEPHALFSDFNLAHYNHYIQKSTKIDDYSPDFIYKLFWIFKHVEKSIVFLHSCVGMHFKTWLRCGCGHFW